MSVQFVGDPTMTFWCKALKPNQKCTVIEGWKNWRISWIIIPRGTITVHGMTMHFSDNIDVYVPTNQQMNLMLGDTLNVSYESKQNARFFLLSWMRAKKKQQVTLFLALQYFENTWPTAEESGINVYHTLLHLERLDGGSPKQSYSKVWI